MDERCGWRCGDFLLGSMSGWYTAKGEEYGLQYNHRATIMDGRHLIVMWDTMNLPWLRVEPALVCMVLLMLLPFIHPSTGALALVPSSFLGLTSSSRLIPFHSMRFRLPTWTIQRMEEMGMKFIEASSEGEKDFSVVKSDSVVVLPAFGASIQEMTMLSDKKVQMVDTTCPWVSKVRRLKAP